MMNAEVLQYLEKWDLKEPKLLAETFTSHVYTVDAKGEIQVLKLLNEIGKADEASGATALEYFAGHGAVRVYRYDEGAHLLEYVAGESLVPMVETGEDAVATLIIAEVLNKLHHQSQAAIPQNLKSLRRWFQALFEKAEADKLAGIESIYRRATPVADNLLSNPQDETVLHGDIHHENIRYHAERGWLAYDPKGLFGERTYDAANTLYNPSQVIAQDEKRLLRTAEILAENLNIEFKRLIAFAFVYGCLSAAWSLMDDNDPEPALNIAALLEKHL